jgi:hypothetical protein
MTTNATFAIVHPPTTRSNALLRKGRQLDERPAHPPLDQHEQDQQGNTDAEDRERAAREPAPCLGTVDGERHRRDPEADGDHAREVEVPRHRLVARLRDVREDESECRGGERNHREEHPAPRERLGQAAADERPERGAERCDSVREADRLPRRRAGNWLESTAIASGKMSAPPAPWMIRKVITTPADRARP